jgi:Tfp pilus assembly protein FimT
MRLASEHVSDEGRTRNTSRAPLHASRFPRKLSGFTPHAFTLIELILVMALLIIAVSMTAPLMARFFRGRTLDSEARRLLALTRHGQSRAVSEGLPMDLWVDVERGSFGLEAEPSYQTTDPKKVEFQLDTGLQMEIVRSGVSAAAFPQSQTRPASIASVPKVLLVRAGLPTIRFLPDGSISETSPAMLRLKGRDGESLYLAQSSTRLKYEIRRTDK